MEKNKILINSRSKSHQQIERRTKNMIVLDMMMALSTIALMFFCNDS